LLKNSSCGSSGSGVVLSGTVVARTKEWGAGGAKVVNRTEQEGNWMLLNDTSRSSDE